MLWFTHQEVTRILVNFKMIGWHEQWWHGKDMYICTSTADEGCESHYMCLILMLGAHLNGSTASTTQLLCFALRGKGTEVQAISSGLANVSTITWQGLIHMSFHIIWWLWNSFSVFGINVKAHWNGSAASTNSWVCCDLPLKRCYKNSRKLQKDWLTRAGVMW